LLERRQGYLQALRDHNLKESFIIDGLIFRKEAYQATDVLLNKFPQVTAIFACNDNAAIGAINCARHLNLRIPQDISIIGFDDIRHYRH
jgi:DNA-binding LacI/PurR family transcriptional regulator